MARTQPDWIAIEGYYRSGTRSLRDIADEYGLSEGAIRKHAKKLGWVRDPAGTKREIVRQAMSGTQDGTQYAMRTIESAAEEDIRDMNRGLRIQRHCLMALEQSAESASEPREVKIIIEAAGAAIESIRRIRGLDEEIRGKSGATSDDEDDARADEIAQRLVARAARTAGRGTSAQSAVGVGVASLGA